MKIKKEKLDRVMTDLGLGAKFDAVWAALQPAPVPEMQVGSIREALRPLAAIWVAYGRNELDEARPERGEREAGVELFSGRGGKQLLMLTDCYMAYNVFTKLGGKL